MFADPMFTSAFIAAGFLAGCLACFFIGRHWERNLRRRPHPEVMDPVAHTPIFHRDFQPPRL